MKRTLPFNPILVQKVYGLSDGNKEIGQIQAKNVSEALEIGRFQLGKQIRCAYLIPGRKEPIFQFSSR